MQAITFSGFKRCFMQPNSELYIFFAHYTGDGSGETVPSVTKPGNLYTGFMHFVADLQKNGRGITVDII